MEENGKRKMEKEMDNGERNTNNGTQGTMDPKLNGLFRKKPNSENYENYFKNEKNECRLTACKKSLISRKKYSLHVIKNGFAQVLQKFTE